jgi:hypothetical protein
LVLYAYLCVFAHSRFVENPPIWSWETNPSFFRWFCHRRARASRFTHCRPLTSLRCHLIASPSPMKPSPTLTVHPLPPRPPPVSRSTRPTALRWASIARPCLVHGAPAVHLVHTTMDPVHGLFPFKSNSYFWIILDILQIAPYLSWKLIRSPIHLQILHLGPCFSNSNYRSAPSPSILHIDPSLCSKFWIQFTRASRIFQRSPYNLPKSKFSP